MKDRLHEGYLMIDHRASPGLPATIAMAAGFDPKEMAEGALAEFKTFGCTHCGSVVRVIQVHPDRCPEYCDKCDHYICRGCKALSTLPGYQHQPIVQRIDRILDGKADDPLPLVLALSS